LIDRVQGYYGFTRVPFGRDLAPSMLHQHNSHREAAARIAWCINNKAIGVVTGEVGAGKAVALKGAVSSLDPARFTVIYQPNPEVGMRGLYARIVTSLGRHPPNTSPPPSQLRRPPRWPPRSTSVDALPRS
jgi:type II secretory pathway predicted ATPase ExeA